jgi:hypothetical protein
MNHGLYMQHTLPHAYVVHRIQVRLQDLGLSLAASAFKQACRAGAGAEAAFQASMPCRCRCRGGANLHHAVGDVVGLDAVELDAGVEGLLQVKPPAHRGLDRGLADAPGPVLLG